MLTLPIWLVEWIASTGLWHRPNYLVQDVAEAPADHELRLGLVHREVRGGHPKWAHFACPRCGEHIALPIVGRKSWNLALDWLRRPTIHPSVWQTGSCGAHFFVQRGMIVWCRD